MKINFCSQFTIHMHVVNVLKFKLKYEKSKKRKRAALASSFSPSNTGKSKTVFKSVVIKMNEYLLCVCIYSFRSNRCVSYFRSTKMYMKILAYFTFIWYFYHVEPMNDMHENHLLCCTSDNIIIFYFFFFYISSSWTYAYAIHSPIVSIGDWRMM